MGWCDKNWCNITYVVLSPLLLSLLFPTLHCFQVDGHDPQSLDSLIHNSSMKALGKHPTGTLVKIPLPSDLRGVKASLLMMRSGTLWDKGVNFSSFHVPPRVIPFPFVRRVALVGQNLGNWSSYYYDVPGYSLVAPVVGLMAYNVSDTKVLGNVSLKLVEVVANPILVHFPRLNITGKHSRGNLKCVKFLPGGLVQLSNLTSNNMCTTQSDGHFSVVVGNKTKGSGRSWRWWAIGSVAGVIGLILVVVIGVTSYKLARSKRVREMEGESENGVAFDTSMVRGTRMPSASMTRTQPALEHRDVP